jgi:hypothetical protein
MIEIINALNTLTYTGAIGLASLCILSGWVAYLIWR